MVGCAYTGVQHLIVLVVRKSLGPVRVMLPEVEVRSALVVIRLRVERVVQSHICGLSSDAVTEVVYVPGYEVVASKILVHV